MATQVRRIKTEIKIVVLSLVLGLLLMPSRVLFFHEVMPAWIPEPVKKTFVFINRLIKIASTSDPKTVEKLRKAADKGDPKQMMNALGLSPSQLSPKPEAPRPSARTLTPETPSKTAQTSQKVQANLSFQGIVYEADGNSQAVIENQILKAGDTAGGYTIRKVNQFNVVLEKDGVTYSLSDSGIKQITD